MSKDPTGTKPNIAGQERRCRELIESRGWETAEVYVDRDRTAAGREPVRPDYARMCSDLRSGRINAVVALDQDRLVRESYELELLLRLCEDVGVEHVVTSEGEVTDEGVTFARIRASIASDEIKKMSKRHRRVQEDLALAGKYSGGYRGFGYSADHSTVVEDEAKLIREAARRVIAGESVEAIAREWNEAGVKTALGNRWRGKSLARIISSPAVTGLREHHGEVVADAVWPAIIDRATWEAVRHTLASRPRAKTGRPPRDYLLTGGLAVCGICGTALRARPRGDKVPSYVCVKEERLGGLTPCGGVRCVAEPLEELVMESVLAAVDEGALERMRHADEDGAERAERVELLGLIADTEEKLAQVEERYLEGDVSRASYLRVRDRHRGIADDARRRLASIERRRLPEDTPRSADELRKWWEDATLAQKRAFLRLFIESVRVKPAAHRGARFSKERIDILWLS